MTPSRWPSAIQRSVVWLGATVLVAYLKKPDGANFLAVRADALGWLGGCLLVAGLAFHFWSNVSLARGETNSAAAALVSMAFFHVRVVRFEEPALRRRFGRSYDEYCRRVPRWI